MSLFAFFQDASLFPPPRCYRISSTSCGCSGSVKLLLPQVRTEGVPALSGSLLPLCPSLFPSLPFSFVIITTAPTILDLDVNTHLSIRLDSQSGKEQLVSARHPNKDLCATESCLRAVSSLFPQHFSHCSLQTLQRPPYTHTLIKQKKSMIQLVTIHPV